MATPRLTIRRSLELQRSAARGRDQSRGAHAASRRRHRRRTNSAADLIIWPENRPNTDPLRNIDAAARIDAVTDVRMPILVGAALDSPDWYEPQLLDSVESLDGAAD